MKLLKNAKEHTKWMPIDKELKEQLISISKISDIVSGSAKKLLLNPDFISLISNEFMSSISKSAMVERVQNFIPAVKPENFPKRGTSGIRTPVISLGLDDKLNPIRFFVSNNYPNPFNPVTTLAYQLSEPAAVSLKVYDLKGKQVMSINEGIKFSGSHDVTVNASTLSSGTYFFVFTAGNFQKTQKVMLLK